MEAEPFYGTLMRAYWFSDAQLARMAQSPLDAARFVAYVENKWTITRLQEHCVSTNRFQRGYQNLVAMERPVDTEIHKGKAHGFDKVWVYVSEDSGKGTYF